MPNWCENILIITGENKDDIERFYNDNYSSEEQPLSFEKQVSLGEYDYFKAIETWGTKWEPNDIRINKEKNSIHYDFMSAWSPPIPWLIKVSEHYPTLSFEMISEEGGCDFRTEILIKHGEIVHNKDFLLSEYNYEQENGDTILGMLICFVKIDNETREYIKRENIDEDEWIEFLKTRPNSEQLIEAFENIEKREVITMIIYSCNDYLNGHSL